MIAAGIYTFNHHKHHRQEEFARTLASIRAAGVQFNVVTNGSTDGTQDIVRGMGGIVDDTDSRIWYGMTLASNWCKQTGADIILLSADDMEYYPDWQDALESFWKDAPDDIIIASAHVEPDYNWNTVTGQGEAGGQHYITRMTVPGCCWSFRVRDFDKIFPLPQIMPGEDNATCARLLSEGYRLAALRLADHIGERNSAWGNQSWTIARPFDYELHGFKS
jgi:GT2 family glycosyltransferase